MTECSWRGRRLVPSLSAQEEIDKEGLDLRGLAELLQDANQSPKRRRSGVSEYLTRRGRKSYKIVLAESMQRWSGEEVFLVIHVKSVKS